MKVIIAAAASLALATLVGITTVAQAGYPLKH